MSAPVLARVPMTALHKLGLDTPLARLLHVPLRYDDETHLDSWENWANGQTVFLEGKVLRVQASPPPRRQLRVLLGNAHGDTLLVRFMHSYPSHLQTFQQGNTVRLLGTVRHTPAGREMVHPAIKSAKRALAAALTPIYPTTQGLSQVRLRGIIQEAFAITPLDDTLPAAWLAAAALPDFAQALQTLHQPPDTATAAALMARTHPAWQRLKLDELIAQQLSLKLAYARRKARSAVAFAGNGERVRALLAHLPFQLTAAQQRAWAQIAHDLAQPHPMQRLLQGDVGAGKTIVAALAAVQVIDGGGQVALMAPTEILAEQHFHKLQPWLAPLGIAVVWLSGSQKKAARRQRLQALLDGSAQLAIGTHALFQQNVQFAALGLAIVDEQHRFGVQQRLALREKGADIHQLMMSATPIPRTLAMTHYADLELSLLDERPPGRQAVVTKLISHARRAEICDRVLATCQQGGQVYWVCPLIETSNTLNLAAVQQTHAQLQQSLPQLRIGLLHGRLPAEEKSTVMQAFSRGQLDVLVATTVIEVGVDVPNASLMIIEHAQHMGLAQLHQLRGRIGRGSRASVCVLLYEAPLSEAAKYRLRVMYEHDDGFEIARLDMALRGHGELLGARQSGLSLLRFADISRDQVAIEQAQAWAARLLTERPDLVTAHLNRWLGERTDWLHS